MRSQTRTVSSDSHFGFAHATVLSPKQNKLLNIFFYTVMAGTFAAMLGIILYYVYAFAAKTHGSADFDWLLGIFSDFVYIMNVSLEESPYIVEDSSYPPLAIAVLYPFALICRGVFAKYANQVMDVDTLTSNVVLHAEFWVAMVLFFVLCSALIIALITYEYRLTPINALKVGGIILMSAPFVYAVMRGNTIYFAMVFLLIFLILHKSENAVLRELGYISLVLAGLIKIYPLFFGVFLLSKKKIWASVRIALYTFALFALSFFIFEGGIDHIKPFVENLGGFAGNELRLFQGNNLSLSHLFYCILYPFSIPGAVFDIVNLSLLVIVFVIATIAAIYTRSDFSRYVIAASVVVLIPSVSYFYVLIFTLLPFMEFLKSYDLLPIFKRKLYTVLFLVLFFTPMILPKNFILQSLAVIIMLVTECTGIFTNELFKRKRALKA